MRRFLPTLLAVLLTVGGCATTEQIGRDPNRQTTILQGGGIMDDAAESSTALIPSPPEEVWSAVFDAYEAMGIRVEHADPKALIMGNRQLPVRRQVGGVRASDYFDCGSTVSGMPAADSYRIIATITTQVIPAEGETQLITEVGGRGQAMQGTSVGEVRCASTGRLEDRIRTATILALQSRGD